MKSYATFHDLWIHMWIHVYEEYCEIIPEIMCTKVPDEVTICACPLDLSGLWILPAEGLLFD